MEGFEKLTSEEAKCLVAAVESTTFRQKMSLLKMKPKNIDTARRNAAEFENNASSALKKILKAVKEGRL